VGCILRLRSLGIEGCAPRLALGVGHGMDCRMKAVMPGKIDESGIIGDTTAGITAVWISLGRRQQPRSARSPAIRSPAAELLVGFQGAIVRVLLQCRDLRRLCRAKIHVLLISYANPPRPPHPRTRSVFFFGSPRAWKVGKESIMHPFFYIVPALSDSALLDRMFA
jgi:hypothetical protein